MNKLYDILNISSKVTVYKTVEDDFYQYGKWFDDYYRDLAGLVKQNHIFSCNIANAREGNKFNMIIKENDLDNATSVKRNMVKQNFSGRKTVQSFAEAVKKRPDLIKAAMSSDLIHCE